MNYGQFLQMIPEATLVAILIIVFFADFALHRSESKGKTLYGLTAALLLLQLVPCALAQPTEAFGGLYVTSQMANVMKTILTAGSLIVVIMAQPWIEGNAKKYSGEFYMLLVSTLLGMYMMISSGNFLMFFLGLETASVPMACMVALDKMKKESAEAAAKYILTATFSSGVMLYGISFVYGATGTLYFNDIATVLAGINPFSDKMLLPVAGLVFFFSGLGFKLSLVPFHFWTADTYQGAPTPVTGYLSVVSKGAAALAAFIILTKVFGPLVEQWELMLGIIIMLTITVGNLFAMRQKELKRFMAYSSISQAGYIMLAALGGSQLGATALTFYVLVYVVANMAVFTVISVVEQNNGGRTDMDAYNGFYTTNPKLSFLMTLALFSLAGIPPFAGMFSKFFVFMAAAGGHEANPFWVYLVVFVALINTVVSLYYYLLIVKAMYIKKTTTPLPTFQSDVNSKLALALCTLGIVAFGIFSCIYNWIAAATV
jgi:NADH-quinone oxidoreductase subunit N